MGRFTGGCGKALEGNEKRRCGQWPGEVAAMVVKACSFAVPG
jgi:hypothetical protein